MSDTPCDNRCIHFPHCPSPPARRQTASPRWASLLYINSSNYAPILSASATHMILFMPWPVQKYITTHLYIIAEFVERGKWGRRGLRLHFSRALRVIPELLRTSFSRNSTRYSHSGLSAFVFMSRHPVKCATCREQALACARLTGF